MGWSSGTYTRAQNFSADASADVSILATRMDAEFDDFASAVPIIIARDGQNTATTNLPMRGKRHINAGAAVAATDYLRMDQRIRDIPVYVTNSDSSFTVPVSTMYASISGALPDGARLRVRTSTLIATQISCSISITRTGEGGQGFPVFTGGGAANRNYFDSIGFRRVYDLIYEASASCFYIANPSWSSNRHQNSATPKCYNAAGTVAGSGPAVTIQLIRQSHAVVRADIAAVSVSCSISAAFLVLSATASVKTYLSGATHNKTMAWVMVRGLSAQPWTAEIATNSPGQGHIRLSRSYNLDGTTVSVNSTVQMGAGAQVRQSLVFF